MNRLELPPPSPGDGSILRYDSSRNQDDTQEDMSCNKDVEESSASAEEENRIKSDDEGERGRPRQMRDELSMNIEVVDSGIPDATNNQDRKLCEVPRRLFGME